MSFWPAKEKTELRPLKYLARFNPEVLPEDTNPDFEFDYIDIGGVTLEDGVRHKEAMRFETAPSRARKPVRSGDVIVSTVRTYLKAVARIDETHDGAIVSTGFAVLRPNANVDAGYLYRLCQANAFVADVEARSTGVSYPAINPSALAAIKVPFPDLATQKAIAAFLDRETARIDKLIEKKKRQVGVLSDACFSAISHAVSVGLDPSIELIETGSSYLPLAPKGWRVWQLKHLAKVRGGITLGRSLNSDESLIPTPYLRVANVQAGRLDLSDVAEIDATAGEVARYSLVAGDVLMNEGGDNDKLGRGAVWTAPFAPCLHQNHVFAVRPNDRRYSEWISLATNARYARDFFFIHSNQSTNLASISKTNVERFPVAVPPVDEMNSILNAIHRRLDILQTASAKTLVSIDRLREHRAALITAAIAGQIDIRENLPAVTSTSDRDRFRLVVGAEIIHRLPDNPKRARVKVHKITYLAETHLGIDALRGNYLREAAGPLDRALREETERSLEAAGYYRANQTDGTGTAVTYTPLAKAGQHKAELTTLLGSKAEALRCLIAMLADLDRRATEAVATLYAVWNDALIDGETPDDAAIINGVLHEWHTEKGEKFTAADLATWLAWMRRHNLTPRGQGPRTTPTMTPRLL